MSQPLFSVLSLCMLVGWSAACEAGTNIIRTGAPITLRGSASNPAAGDSETPPVVTPAPSKEECAPDGSSSATTSWITLGSGYGSYQGAVKAISWLTLGDVLANSDYTFNVQSYTKDGWIYTRKDLYTSNIYYDYYHVCRVPVS